MTVPVGAIGMGRTMDKTRKRQFLFWRMAWRIPAPQSATPAQFESMRGMI